MSDDIGATVRQWTDVVRRARLGRTVKLVALTIASYADANGRRIFPGVARLAVDCEIGYNVVKNALAVLRKAGLIEAVAAPTRRGRAVEYRLILHPDLMERISLPTPAAHALEADRLAATKRGRHTPKQPSPRPTASAADEAAQPVENPEPRPTPWAADTRGETGSAAHGVTPNDKSAAHGVCSLQPTPLPPTSHEVVTTTTSHESADVRTAVTVSRGREPVEKPDSHDGQTSNPDPPALRLIEGNPDASLPGVVARGLWPHAVPDEPRAAVTTGNGFCVDCYRTGQITLAADPTGGSACNYHLKAREAS